MSGQPPFHQSNHRPRFIATFFFIEPVRVLLFNNDFPSSKLLWLSWSWSFRRHSTLFPSLHRFTVNYVKCLPKAMILSFCHTSFSISKDFSQFFIPWPSLLTSPSFPFYWESAASSSMQYGKELQKDRDAANHFWRVASPSLFMPVDFF